MQEIVASCARPVPESGGGRLIARGSPAFRTPDGRRGGRARPAQCRLLPAAGRSRAGRSRRSIPSRVQGCVREPAAWATGARHIAWTS